MTDDDPVALCLSGRIAPNVALARLILAGASACDIAHRLAAGSGAAAEAMRRLLSARRDAIAALIEAARAVDHTVQGPAALASLRTGFDRAARVAPEASVAFYTLGDPALLQAATDEIVAWLDANGLLGPHCDALDLGCGIGRVAAALAPHVRSVLGVDVAPEMLRQARLRYGRDPRLRFALTRGERLGVDRFPPPGSLPRFPPPGPLPQGEGERWMTTRPLAGGKGERWMTPPPLAGGGRGEGHGQKQAHTTTFDLVLAADSFPYLVQAGVAEAHVADAARLIGPGGALVILNLSYRDPAQDRADARRWAAQFGFRLRCDGAQPFKLWDAKAFVLEQVRGPARAPNGGPRARSDRGSDGGTRCRRRR